MHWGKETIKRTAIGVVLCLFIALSSKGQAWQKCATPKLDSHSPGAITQFESWLQKRISSLAGRQEEDVVTLPVVVHVIHRGESVGTGTNISFDQIASQMDVLNEDYRMTHPYVEDTEERFSGLATDMQVEFVLAKRDPEGLPTNGIIRVRGPETWYEFPDNVRLKSLSYWPAEDYINIWVAPIGDNFIGWAQFPQSTLPGLENSSENELTDGVVIDYEYFGRVGNLNEASRGRTLTHEIGHFLGLRHIWGDGNCDVDDYVSDTPVQDSPNYSCGTRESCTSHDMVQNFMDYTSDQCMTLFTQEQKTRARTVLASSPRRRSLLTSKGGLAPVMVANDIGVRAVVSPAKALCDPTFTPIVEVRNYGTSLATSYTLSCFLEGSLHDTQLVNKSLTTLSRDTVAFAPITLTRSSTYSLMFVVQAVNEGPDGNWENDTLHYQVTYSNRGSLPMTDRFNGVGSGWVKINPDRTFGWQQQVVTIDDIPDTVLVNNLFNYELGVGEEDMYLSPVVDLSQVASSQISFQVGYAKFSSGAKDRLEVRVSKDCGNTFSEPILNLFSNELATAPTHADAFIPNHRLDFRPVTVDLKDYVGEPSLQVALVSVNHWGNNLYVDDILWTATEPSYTDLALESIQGLPFGIGIPKVQPSLVVRNTGHVSISDFSLKLTWNGEDSEVLNVNSTLFPGEKQVVELPEYRTTTAGIHRLQISLIGLSSNLTDDNAKNNLVRSAFWFSEETETLPLRINGEDALKEWKSYSLLNGKAWQAVTLEGSGPVLVFDGYNDDNLNNESILVSPALDFSQLTEASLFFELSYTHNPWYSDSLSVFVSPDNGKEWQRIWFTGGALMGPRSNNAPWVPTGATSWERKHVGLSEYTGNPHVRIAIVAHNAFGQSIYLRNIEAFLSSNPEPFAVEDGKMFSAWPNPAVAGMGNLTLSLPKAKAINLTLLDSRGRKVWEVREEKGLNQTYPISFSSLESGIYFVTVTTDERREVQRWVIIP